MTEKGRIKCFHLVDRFFVPTVSSVLHNYYMTVIKISTQSTDKIEYSHVYGSYLNFTAIEV